MNGAEGIEVVEKIGSSVYIFETKHQVKYLSFIVGGLSKVKEDNGSLPFTLYFSSGISYQKKAILEEAKKIVRFYESKFGSYPYEKLSIVQRLWSTSGGHSPSSFIVLNELPEIVEEERQFQKIRSPVDLSRWKEYFLAHEIAHQWWGQCVTWRTYHDQWLSEGLAQFASYLYLKEKYGDEASSQIIKKFSQWTVKSSKWGPITMGSRISFHNFKAYQAIIYDKASLALNMLKDLVGEEVFFQGLREFFTKFKYSIAGTKDFIRTMEGVSGKDLKAFFESWFDSHFLPEVRVSSSVHKKENGYLLTFKTSQLREPFVFPFWVEWMESGQKVKKMVVVDEKNEEFEFEMPGRPTRVRMNPDLAVPGKFF
jgi:aminopeptidase N